jgi:hypothetical protein
LFKRPACTEKNTAGDRQQMRDLLI